MKVSGLDVHKDSIFCAIYDGKVYSEVKEYATMTESIGKMGEYLQSEGVVRIAMESTSIYQMFDVYYKSINYIFITQISCKYKVRILDDWELKMSHKSIKNKRAVKIFYRSFHFRV